MSNVSPRFARRGALLFLASAICWTVFSNQLTLALPLQPEYQHLVQTTTGLVLAVLVAGLLYWQLKRSEAAVVKAAQRVDAAAVGSVALVPAGATLQTRLPPGMAAAVSRRVAVEAGLLLARLDDEFSLQLQPRWCVRTRRTVGAEALLRWNCPGIGAVMPEEFIPIAEQHQVIRDLGRWTVVQVVRALAPRHGRHPALQVSINLSARQLQDKGFPCFVAATVTEAGLAPSCIEFELTGTSLVCNLDAAGIFLGALRDSGFSVALDDFGAGYSSLSYLARFPVDAIKLDRSLVETLPGDAATRKVASGLIAMAAQLGIRTIGEGVETEAQRQFLEDAGCREAQGWLVASALPEDEFFRRQERQEGHAVCTPA